MMSQPGQGVLLYWASHAFPIMTRLPPNRWWQACQALPEGEIRQEVTAWLRIEKQRRDCWARRAAPPETKKPRR